MLPAPTSAEIATRRLLPLQRAGMMDTTAGKRPLTRWIWKAGRRPLTQLTCVVLREAHIGPCPCWPGWPPHASWPSRLPRWIGPGRGPPGRPGNPGPDELPVAAWRLAPHPGELTENFGVRLPQMRGVADEEILPMV